MLLCALQVSSPPARGPPQPSLTFTSGTGTAVAGSTLPISPARQAARGEGRVERERTRGLRFGSSDKGMTIICEDIYSRVMCARACGVCVCMWVSY